jgi:Tfp pilus assembly protein PilV
MPNSHPSRRSRHSLPARCLDRRLPRTGFTVAELLVGLLLLTVGLIGTAGTATVLTYHTAASVRAERATNAALSKLATVRATGCVAHSGTDTDGPLTLSWTVRIGDRSASADVIVTYRELGHQRVRSYSASLLC